MNGYDIKEIAKQSKVDWMAYPPRERAWIYIEKNKGYWHSVCRRYTLNWEAARELFGDVILLKALHHSQEYDEIVGVAFSTYMSRNLMFDIRRTVSRRLKRKKIKTYLFSQTVECNKLGGEEGEELEIIDKQEPVEFETKQTLQDALDSLKKYDEFAYNVFIDHTLNGYDKTMLSARYRCGRYIVNSYLAFAKRYLAKYIGNE